jgi:hypothetical protein
MAGLQSGREPRKDLDRALKEADITRQWFPINREPCQQDLSVNHHFGAGGASTPGRIQDPEGAKSILVSYKTTAGAAATISIQLFKIYSLLCIPQFMQAHSGHIRHHGREAGPQQAETHDDPRIQDFYALGISAQPCALRTQGGSQHHTHLAHWDTSPSRLVSTNEQSTTRLHRGR